MTEITDNTIKRKHKEFNDRIRRVLEEVRGKEQEGFPPAMQKLGQQIKEIIARKRNEKPL